MANSGIKKSIGWCAKTHWLMLVCYFRVPIKYPRRFSVKASRSCPDRLTCGGYMGSCVGVMRGLRGWFFLSYRDKQRYTTVLVGYIEVIFEEKICMSNDTYVLLNC